MLSIRYSNVGIEPYQTIAVIIIGYCLLFLIKKIKKEPTNSIVIVIFALGAFIRIIYILMIPTVPFSDFEYYHNNALDLSNNIPIFSKNAGYVSILSLGYRIYPNIITGKILNLIASLVSLYLVYLLGKQLFNKKIGVISLFLFSILVNEINMVSVIGTEIIAECLLLLFINFGIKATESKKIKRSAILFLLAGISFSLGVLVRSAIIFYILICLLFFINISKKKILFFIFFICGVLISILILASYFSIINGEFSFNHLLNQDSFPILSGTNINSDGGWNIKDADLYFSWEEENRDKLARNEAYLRLQQKPLVLLSFFLKKFNRLFASNDYGNEWSLQIVDWKNSIFNNFIKTYCIKVNSLFSQSIYIIILFFSFFASKVKKQIPFNSIFLFLTIIASTIPFVIIEVQPRYHHFLLTLLIPFSALGINEIIYGNIKGK